MTDNLPEPLIRADELEAIGAESSLCRAMAAHTIRLLYKENEALRARLEQGEPEHEPIAIVDTQGKLVWREGNQFFPNKPVPLYDAIVNTSPLQRGWQGLTDEEIRTAAFLGIYEKPLIEFARAIEAKLKEKNT